MGVLQYRQTFNQAFDAALLDYHFVDTFPGHFSGPGLYGKIKWPHLESQWVLPNFGVFPLENGETKVCCNNEIFHFPPTVPFFFRVNGKKSLYTLMNVERSRKLIERESNSRHFTSSESLEMSVDLYGIQGALLRYRRSDSNRSSFLFYPIISTKKASNFEVFGCHSIITTKTAFNFGVFQLGEGCRPIITTRKEPNGEVIQYADHLPIAFKPIALAGENCLIDTIPINIALYFLSKPENPNKNKKFV